MGCNKFRRSVMLQVCFLHFNVWDMAENNTFLDHNRAREDFMDHPYEFARRLEEKISELPAGYISRKQIHGKTHAICNGQKPEN